MPERLPIVWLRYIAVYKISRVRSDLDSGHGLLADRKRAYGLR
jgi:hypothetical protein